MASLPRSIDIGAPGFDAPGNEPTGGRDDTPPLAPARSSLGIVSVVFALCLAMTLLIAIAPSLRFAFRSPATRVPLEMLGVVVAALAAVLASFRYSLTGARSFLFVALAFVAIGLNRFLFGVAGGDAGATADLDVYYWTTARLMMAALLLLGALPSGRFWRTDVRPLRDLLLGSAVIVTVMGWIDFVLWANADRIPAIASSSLTDPAAVAGWRPDLSATDLALGFVGAAAFLVAAVLYARPGAGGSVLLAPALVLAAFAHVHYMLAPTIFGGWISTGDLLRLGFTIAVMVGLMVEVHQAYRVEHDRIRGLALAYAAERRRVEELEALDRTRAELLRMTTHELMHPVSALRSWIVALRHRWGTFDDEQKLEVLRKLDEESGRLADMAERAPEMTGSGARALIFPIAPRSERVVDLVNEATAALGLDGRLTVDLDPGIEHVSVMADATRVLQVLRNLLSNALKHSGPQPDVELWVHGLDPDVWFTVADRGPGIPPEDLERVFDLAYRTAGRPGDDGPGSGLGLYICRRIVEAHEGQIWAERRLGGGAVVTFTLPVTDAER
jgi:signal transduction histidine kinase